MLLGTIQVVLTERRSHCVGMFRCILVEGRLELLCVRMRLHVGLLRMEHPLRFDHFFRRRLIVSDLLDLLKLQLLKILCATILLANCDHLIGRLRLMNILRLH